jgi:UDP-glucose 4-epimerase
MNILLTGGAGYIGSHAAVALTEAGHNVTIFDNFSNSHRSVMEALYTITFKKLSLVEGDIRDQDLLGHTLKHHHIEAVMHFAGLKSVGESVKEPALYFNNNVEGTRSLIAAMKAVGIKTLIFSSSATVYGVPQYLPFDEDHPLAPTNPYGQNKMDIEVMLQKLTLDDPEWRVVSLRYFNPAGAHPSGLIGENPQGIPNNLMPYIVKVASSELPHLNIFGDDYDTVDGTGVRDYIHVTDLVTGHLQALDYTKTHTGCSLFNLGKGQGVSVLQLVKAFEAATGQTIPYQIKPRREGDVATSYAKVEKAAASLHFHATRDIHDLCASAWRFYEVSQGKLLRTGHSGL